MQQKSMVDQAFKRHSIAAHRPDEQHTTEATAAYTQMAEAVPAAGKTPAAHDDRSAPMMSPAGPPQDGQSAR